MNPIADKPFAINRLSFNETLERLKWYSKIISPFPKIDYFNPTNGQRMKLITLVCTRKMTIKDAATEIGLKYTTAKSIWTIYRNQGRIMKQIRRPKKVH